MQAFPPSYVFTNIINILPLICLHCTSSTFTFIDNCNQVLKIFFNFMDKIKHQNFQELSVWDSLSESLNSWWRLTWVFWVTQCIVRLWLFVFQIVSKVCLCFEHLQKNGVSRYSKTQLMHFFHLEIVLSVRDLLDCWWWRQWRRRRMAGQDSKVYHRFHSSPHLLSTRIREQTLSTVS